MKWQGQGVGGTALVACLQGAVSSADGAPPPTRPGCFPGRAALLPDCCEPWACPQSRCRSLSRLLAGGEVRCWPGWS